MPATRSAQHAIEEFVEAIAAFYLESKKTGRDNENDDAESFVSAIEQDLKSTLRDRLAEIGTVDDDPLANTVDLTMGTDPVIDQTLDPSESRDAEFSHDPVDIATMDGAENQVTGDTDGSVRVSSGTAARGGSNTKIGAGKKSRSKASRQAADLPAGYEVLDVLGKGGMGIVYKAKHVPLNRIVAVKKIIAGADATDEQINRFQREAEAAAHLSHPNIVSVYEVGQHKGMPFFSLEYVEGQSLSDLMRETTMSGHDAADLLIPISDAIFYSHEKGVLHRDLKPQNILLNQDGVPKVADFGLAKRLDDEDDSEKTRAGLILGTPGYMAPEQAMSSDELGPHTDVYALGSILYYMMTGRPPFTAPTPFETVRQVLRDEPVPPSRLQTGLDRDLETICLKALEKDIDRRYRTAREFADELRRYRNGEPILARPVTRTERVWKWCKRNPKMATMASLAASLALIVMIGGPTSAAVIYDQKQEVVAEKDRADANATQAEQNALQAEQNAELAVEAKQAAEKNAVAAAVQEKNAIDALRSMTFVVQQKMVGKTDLVDLREELLTTVRNGLMRMEKNQNTARSQDMISAGIHTRLGDINMEIGRVAKARQEYGHCIAIFEKLEQGDGQQIPGRLVNWSKIHQLMGDACRAAGDFPQAIEHHKKSLEFRRQADAKSSTDQTKSLVALSLGKLGSITQVQGDLDAARDYMTQAVALREELHDRQPENVGPMVEWLGAKLVLAKVLFQQLDTGSSLVLMREAVEGMKQVASSVRNDSTTQDNAMFHGEFAVLQLYLGDVDRAADDFRFAVDAFEGLQAKEPNDLRIHQELEESLYGLSVANMMQGDVTTADKLMNRVVTMRRQTLALDESNSSSKIRLLLALARAGHLDEGVRLADELDASLESDHSTRYELACGYAQLADARSAIEKTSDPSTLPTEQELTEKAFANLQQALDGGFWKEADLKLDPDLAPLRSSADFENVIAR